MSPCIHVTPGVGGEWGHDELYQNVWEGLGARFTNIVMERHMALDWGPGSRVHFVFSQECSIVVEIFKYAYEQIP